MQTIRSELEKLRLQADVAIPAEVDRRVCELIAAGEAATIAENGRAMAEALRLIADAWREADGDAMDMFLLQNSEKLLGRVAKAAKTVDVRSAAIVDAGDGTTIPSYVASYPATVAALLREVTSTLGVNIPAALGATGSTESAVNRDWSKAANS